MNENKKNNKFAKLNELEVKAALYDAIMANEESRMNIMMLRRRFDEITIEKEEKKDKEPKV
jgi:hypothetical protein